MLFVSITEIEAAINFWRSKSPSQGESLILCPEASALAKPYALLILQGAQRISVDHLDAQALSAWQMYMQFQNKTL